MNGYPTWVIPGLDGAPAVSRSGLLTLDQLSELVGADTGVASGSGGASGALTAAEGKPQDRLQGAPRAKAGVRAFGGAGSGGGMAGSEDCEDCKLSDNPNRGI